MTTITFDTQEAVIKLKAIGVSQEQADAFVRVIVESQHELSTKRDIDDLRKDIDTRLIEMEQRLIIKQCALLAFAIGIVAVLVKLL